MAKATPPAAAEAAFFSHISDPAKRAAMNAAARANPEDAANPEKAPASPPPDLLYSTKDLQAILDKYEEERRKALEEEIKKASQNLPAMLPQQSVADYVNVNRNLIKTKSPQLFERIGAVNKSEHEEMQQKGGYRPISFNKGAPSSLDIMGKDNKPIYTLNYRSDGELVIAKVPPSISKGPMHLSLALQDANGENIEADKAAYFNISYGADGKIKSMNYPEPLEFEGDRCKFLIEDQPYYLKVNKAILDVLNAELAKNRGQGVKRAQDVGFEPVLDDQEHQPQHQPIIAAPATPFAPEARAEVVAVPSVAPHPIAIDIGMPEHEVPIEYRVVQEPAKPALRATAIEGINPKLDEAKRAIVYSSMPQRAGYVGDLATQTPASAVRQAVLLPSVEEVDFRREHAEEREMIAREGQRPQVAQRQIPEAHPLNIESFNIPSPNQVMALGGMEDNHNTELGKAQQAMAEAVKKRVKGGKYNLPPDPIKVLGSKTSSPVAENPRHEVPKAQEPRHTPVAQEALDPEMPKELHEVAQAAAGAVANMMLKAHEKPVAKTDPTPPAQKDKAKPVVIGNAVKAQHDAAKPFGDPEHNKYSSPPVGAPLQPLNMDKTPTKKHAVVQQATGLGGKKAEPLGDGKHNEFAVPPGGFNNEIPQWQQDLAKKNALAKGLRESSAVVDSAPNPISPSPTAAGAPPHDRNPQGRS